MWEKYSETKEKRKYRNKITGSECSTSLSYTDPEGNQWWTIDNLFTLPFMRQFAATKISSLYQLGFTKDDLTDFVKNLKNTLRSEGKEKYESCYAQVLDFESKIGDATNATRQVMSLVCVYNLLNDERIDIFDQEVQQHKLALLEADFEAQSFFLNRQIERTEIYGNHLDLFLKTVSKLQNGT